MFFRDAEPRKMRGRLGFIAHSPARGGDRARSQ